MKKVIVTATVMLLLLAVWSLMATAQEEKAEEFEYVGSKKCKMCHKDIYEAWEKTSHAEAWGALTAEEQKKEECISCHITGETADGEMLTSVGCEACHGPGSEYKSIKIMNKKKWAENPEEYKQKAIEAGLVYPTEEDCKTCHKKEGNPNFKPLDFETAKDKVHPVKAEG